MLQECTDPPRGLPGGAAREGDSFLIFWIANPGTWADVIDSPKPKLVFPGEEERASWAGQVFPSIGSSFGSFSCQRLDNRCWVCRQLSECLPTQIQEVLIAFEAAGMSFARHTLIMGDFMPLLEKPGKLSRKKNLPRP